MQTIKITGRDIHSVRETLAGEECWFALNSGETVKMTYADANHIIVETNISLQKLKEAVLYGYQIELVEVK